jgi:hypothetical protein
LQAALIVDLCQSDPAGFPACSDTIQIWRVGQKIAKIDFRYTGLKKMKQP